MMGAASVLHFEALVQVVGLGAGKVDAVVA